MVDVFSILKKVIVVVVIVGERSFEGMWRHHIGQNSGSEHVQYGS